MGPTLSPLLQAPGSHWKLAKSEPHNLIPVSLPEGQAASDSVRGKDFFLFLSQMYFSFPGFPFGMERNCACSSEDWVNKYLGGTGH